MDFRIAHFLRCGRLAVSVPLVGCWLLGCLWVVACSAGEGAFFVPMTGQKSMLHGEASPPLMRCGGAMPRGYIIPLKTVAQPPLHRPGQPQPAPDLHPKGNDAARTGVSPTRVQTRRRSPSAILVARRAEEHICYALALAERGAAYSAEAEFTQVLRLVAQTLDQESGKQVHSRAMVAGLRALREADDFASRDSDPADVEDLARCIATHRTPVLKGADTTRLTPMDALQQYHTFASQQLASACGREPSASMALYGLARLQSVLNVGSGPRRSTAETNAIALHQAALAVDRQNYMAANELGVLLARYGQMQSARTLLRHSLSICESSEIWHNLSVLYQEMGASDAAKEARQRSENCAASQSSRHGRTLGGSPRSTVYWVDAATLARSSGVDEAIGPAMPTAPPTRQQYASPWPQTNATVTAAPDPSPAPSPVERFKTFFGLGEQEETASRYIPPDTSQPRYVPDPIRTDAAVTRQRGGLR